MSLVDGPGRTTVSIFDDTPSLNGQSMDAHSQRKAVDGLENPCPLARLLPSMFYDDSFAMRLCAGLDEILAPVLVTLDCLDDYFDPCVTPPDFLDWLARWVGLALDQNWPHSRQRALLRSASELYRWEGTARGISGYVRLVTGTVPDVVDNGGVAWSSEPGAELPGSSVDEVVVRLQVFPGSPAVDVAQVEAVVAATKPAHVPHRVELFPGRAGHAGGPADTNAGKWTDETRDRVAQNEADETDKTSDEHTHENLSAAEVTSSEGADETGLSAEEDGAVNTGDADETGRHDGPNFETG